MLYIRYIIEYTIALYLYIFLSVYELIICYIKKINLNHSLNASKINYVYSPIVKNIKKINFIDINCNDIDNYIKTSEPFIIKNIPKDYFNFTENLNDDYDTVSDDKMIIKTYFFPNLKKLGSFIYNLLGKHVLYMACFSGNYKSGHAHIDAFPSYNFYYVHHGVKECWIIPPENRYYVNMKNGIDNVYIDNSANNNSWLSNIPYYYNDVVSEGEVLIFNNSKCIHKFTNMKDNNIIYTIRLSSFDADALVIKHDIFNWNMCKHFSNIVIDKLLIRDVNCL